MVLYFILKLYRLPLHTGQFKQIINAREKWVPFYLTITPDYMF